MNRYHDKKASRKMGKIYFNYNKFEKLLDKLQAKGIDITTDEYEVKKLKAFKEFKYFFDTFTHQEIKSHLLFYQYQVKDQ